MQGNGALRNHADGHPALIHFSLEQLRRVLSTGGLEGRLPKAGCLGELCRSPAMAGHLDATRC